MKVCSEEQTCVIEAVHAIEDQKGEVLVKATHKLAQNRKENKNDVCLCWTEREWLLL